MKKEINFGIGFYTGRPNVCNIINAYADHLVEQVKDLPYKVNFTIFLLFDLGYQYTTRTDFYSILPKVYKNVYVKYITPEEIEESKKIIMSKYDLAQADVDLFLGRGYGKARNAILYNALRKKMDYLLFWDDDEYPLANVKEGKEVEWFKQDDIVQHLKNIEKADVTMGYRCGFMSPVPYIEYNDIIKEEDYHKFIDGLSNEIVNWEWVQEVRKDPSGLTFAEKDIANHTRKPTYLEDDGVLIGSGICLNLRHLDKIPAFYNPPGARGEDTFFGCALKMNDAKVLRVPTYHFHDCFLKYTSLMKERYPKVIKRIALDDNGIEQRFLRTTIGWTKYKPLYFYITDNDNYRKIMKKTRENLVDSIPKINTAFETCEFDCLIPELDDYDKNVKKHFKEFVRTNEIWNHIKERIKDVN